MAATPRLRGSTDQQRAGEEEEEGYALVASLDEELDVRVHEGNGHGDVNTVGEDKVGVEPHLLDEREDVCTWLVSLPSWQEEGRDSQSHRPQLRPAECSLSSKRNSSISKAAVMVSMRTVALIDPRLMDRRSCDILKASFQSRHSRWDSILGRLRENHRQRERAVGCEYYALEVRTGSSGEELGGVVEEVESKVEEGSRHGLAVDDNVGLVKVPSTGSDEEGRAVGVQLVELATSRGLERDRLADSVAQVDLSVEVVGPGGGTRVWDRHSVSVQVDAGRRPDSPSKSAMKVLAPELRAPMTIFLETGPVISTLRSSSPGMGAGPIQVGSFLMCSVDLRKLGRAPASNSAWRRTRALRRLLRVGLNERWRTARKARDSGVIMSRWAPENGSLATAARGRRSREGTDLRLYLVDGDGVVR